MFLNQSDQTHACLPYRSQDNSEVHFKVKMTTKFEKVRREVTLV